MVTDLRIIFFPLCITSSLWWQSGATTVPLNGIRGSLSSLNSLSSGLPVATEESMPSVGALRTVRRYTYVLPLTAVLDCKAMPTPSHSSMAIAKAMEEHADVLDATVSTVMPPPPPPGTDATSRDRALAAFLKRADNEYDTYCREQCNGSDSSTLLKSDTRGQGSLYRQSGTCSTDMASHNLVIIAKDGATVEFTVPSLLPEGCVLTLPPLSGNGAQQDLSTIPARFYGSGLCSQLVTPDVWTARVRELVLWKASEDLCSVLWSQYMRLSVEMHLKKLEAIALTEDFDEDDGDEDDEGYGDDDWSDNTGSAFGEGRSGITGQGHLFFDAL